MTGTPPSRSSHSNLVPLKYGSSTRPVRRRTRSRAPGGGELVAARRRAPVLPHDGPAVRPAGRAVPRHDRLALVGDADRRHGWRADLLDDVVAASPGRPPRSRVASCSTQPGLREVLGELAVRRRRRAGRRRTRPGCGCPVVPASMAMTHVIGASALLRLRWRFGPRRRAPRRRRAGAGRDRVVVGGCATTATARGVRRSASVLRCSRTWPARSRTQVQRPADQQPAEDRQQAAVTAEEHGEDDRHDPGVDQPLLDEPAPRHRSAGVPSHAGD